MLSTLYNYLLIGISTLFFFQSSVLFVRSKNSKARTTMALLDLLWGLIYLQTFLRAPQIAPHQYELLSGITLVLGSFYISLTHFFPIQVLLPGWLNWKRGFLLLLPVIVLTGIYYGGMALLGEKPEKIYSYSDLQGAIGHFNLWFRFVILLSNFVYLFLILKWLYGFEKNYIQWKNENFSDQEYVDISWMRSYGYIIVGITLFYISLLFLGNRIFVLFHGLFAIFSFSYLFYKILFYESPYPKDFFSSKYNATTAENATNLYVLPESMTLEKLNEQTFENKIASYTALLKQWMEEEKPFLYNDFKLTDVSRVLPLNRSYLSRIFNEGFGQNFSEVVRAYRVDYSKEILRKNPSIPTYQVASLSGFRSDSTFIKAFKTITHMTPKQYKGLEFPEQAPL